MSKEFIAQKLKEFRERKGLTVSDVAKIFNKSIKTVYAWETGHGQPDADTLIQLCLLYGINSFDALTDSDICTDKIELTNREKLLVSDFRNLSEQGQDYILQTMDMVKEKYKKDYSNTDMAKIG